METGLAIWVAVQAALLALTLFCWRHDQALRQAEDRAIEAVRLRIRLGRFRRAEALLMREGFRAVPDVTRRKGGGSDAA